jgi:hypothetical protein
MEKSPHGKFWALIENINGGKIPDQCFLQLQREMTLELATAYNKDTFMAGLASAPYRTGVGKFAAQFKPDKPYSATIAIESGVHGEHGNPLRAIFSPLSHYSPHSWSIR